MRLLRQMLTNKVSKAVVYRLNKIPELFFDAKVFKQVSHVCITIMYGARMHSSAFTQTQPTLSENPTPINGIYNMNDRLCYLFGSYIKSSGGRAL